MSDEEKEITPHWADDPDVDFAADAEEGSLGWFVALVAIALLFCLAYHALDLYLAPPAPVFPAPVIGVRLNLPEGTYTFAVLPAALGPLAAGTIVNNCTVGTSLTTAVP